MRYERDIQKVYTNAKELLRRALCIEHIGGRAGRLEDQPRDVRDYRAVFVFNSEDKKRRGELEGLLRSVDYKEVDFRFENRRINNVPETSNLWGIILISHLGKSIEQEEKLVRALNQLCEVLGKKYANQIPGKSLQRSEEN